MSLDTVFPARDSSLWTVVRLANLVSLRITGCCKAHWPSSFDDERLRNVGNTWLVPGFAKQLSHRPHNPNAESLEPPLTSYCLDGGSLALQHEGHIGNSNKTLGLWIFLLSFKFTLPAASTLVIIAPLDD